MSRDIPEIAYAINIYKENNECERNCPLWDYVSIVEKRNDSGRNYVKWTCNFCGKSYGGSYSRVRAHLFKEKGKGICSCDAVTVEDIQKMTSKQEAATKVTRKHDGSTKKTETKNNNSSMNNNNNPILSPSFKPDKNSNKRKMVKKYLKATERDKSERERLDSKIARMFYSASLPFDLAKNPDFIDAIKYAANSSLVGYTPPTFNALRTRLLEKEKTNVMQLLESIKYKWREDGVSIVTDGWSDVRSLINFIAISDGKAVFLKAVDCSGKVKDANNIYELLKATIDEVGRKSIVQVITGNTAICKAAGELIEKEYANIFWSPCMVDTLNLALKNICASTVKKSQKLCEWISNTTRLAIFVRNFIVSHPMRSDFYEEFPGLKSSNIPDFRLGTTVVMLERMKKMKLDLQSMVVGEKWVQCNFDNVKNATNVRKILLSDFWWSEVDYILQFTLPIFTLLQLVDTDTPSLHSIIEKWDHMMAQVESGVYADTKRLPSEKCNLFNVIYNILTERWSKGCTPLYCMAHSLNPRYYCAEWLDEFPNRVPPHKDQLISGGRNIYFERYFVDEKQRFIAMREYYKFSTGSEEMGNINCLIGRWTREPKEWWTLYGASLPNLQALALRLLAQPCSSSSCERNCSMFSRTQSNVRCKLEPQRADDLVFVNINLRLLSKSIVDPNEGPSRNSQDGSDDDNLQIDALQMIDSSVLCEDVGDIDYLMQSI